MTSLNQRSVNSSSRGHCHRSVNSSSRGHCHRSVGSSSRGHHQRSQGSSSSRGHHQRSQGSSSRGHRHRSESRRRYHPRSDGISSSIRLPPDRVRSMVRICWFPFLHFLSVKIIMITRGLDTGRSSTSQPPSSSQPHHPPPAQNRLDLQKAILGTVTCMNHATRWSTHQGSGKFWTSQQHKAHEAALRKSKVSAHSCWTSRSDALAACGAGTPALSPAG